MANAAPVFDAVSRSGRSAVFHGGPARAGFKLVTIDNRVAAFAMDMKAFAGAYRPSDRFVCAWWFPSPQIQLQVARR